VYGGGKERAEEAGFPDQWEWREIRKNCQNYIIFCNLKKL